MTQVLKRQNIGRPNFEVETVRDTGISLTNNFIDVLKIVSKRTSKSTINVNNTAEPVTAYTIGASTSTGNGPRYITIDQNTGNRYITTTGSNKVEVYNSAGALLFGFGSEILIPRGIIMDSDGNIYVCDTSANAVKKFTSTGEFIFEFAMQGNPLDITCDENNNLHITDSTLDEIHIHNPLGQLLKIYGSSGSGDGELNNPQGISSRGNRVFISETTNNRVSVFDLQGNFIFNFGSTGAGDGQFDQPRDVVTTIEDDIIVSDQANDRIQTFDSEGNFKFETTPFGGVINGIDVEDSTGDIIVINANLDVYQLVTQNTPTVTDILEYRIFGSAQNDTDFPDYNDSQWINLLSVKDVEENTTSYNHDFSTTLAVNARTYEILTNRWSKLLVQMQAQTTNTSVKAWHRGQN